MQDRELRYATMTLLLLVLCLAALSWTTVVADDEDPLDIIRPFDPICDDYITECDDQCGGAMYVGSCARSDNYVVFTCVSRDPDDGIWHVGPIQIVGC